LENIIEPERISVELLCSSYSEGSQHAGKSSGPQNLASLSTLLELNLEALWRLNSYFLHTFCQEEYGGIYNGVKSVLWPKVGLRAPTC
jgi:hypothetical protein